jgi:hypothetical protein
MPEEILAQVFLRPSQWIGKQLAQTELGRWADTSLFSPDATVVFPVSPAVECFLKGWPCCPSRSDEVGG